MNGITILISRLVLKHGLICCIYVRSCVYTYVWFLNYLNQMQSTQNCENETGKLAEVYATEKASVAFREPVTVWIQSVSDAGLHAVNRSTQIILHTVTLRALSTSFFVYVWVNCEKTGCVTFFALLTVPFFRPALLNSKGLRLFPKAEKDETHAQTNTNTGRIIRRIACS